MPRWLYSLIATATAAIVGGISYNLTDSIPLAVVYGLLTGVIAFTLTETTSICRRLEKKVSEWELKVLNLQNLMPYLEQADPYVKEQVDSSLRELRRLAEKAIEGEVILKTRSIQRDCIDLLGRVQSGDVFATSYVNPKFFWCLPEGALYRQKCFELIQRGIKVTRVFIQPATADEEERQYIEDEIAKQKENGVRVKKVLESTLPAECKKDFLLIPGKYVAYLGVGARGDVLEHLRVCFSPEELNTAQKWAQEIETFSTEC